MDVGALIYSSIPVALLGALLGLDMVSFPQIMISRPIVAATVAGALLGRPGAGLLAGATLELIALETLPFGASRYAEWGSAAAVGGALMAAHPQGNAGAFPFAIFGALATAVLSSRSMVWLRNYNARVARRMRVAIDAGDASIVDRVQIHGLVADFVRGFAVTLAALLVLSPLSTWVVGSWQTDAMHSRALVTALAAIVGAGAIWTLSHRAARAGWMFVLGLVAGTALLFVVA